MQRLFDSAAERPELGDYERVERIAIGKSQLQSTAATFARWIVVTNKRVLVYRPNGMLTKTFDDTELLAEAELEADSDIDFPTTALFGSRAYRPTGEDIFISHTYDRVN